MSAAILAVSLSACESPELFKVNAEDLIDEDIVVTSQIDENIQTETEATIESPIEYKTIDPPEDGWTLELLNEVTYINGKDIDFPFCLNDLGEDFTFGDVSYDEFNQKSSQFVYYKNKKAFFCTSPDDDGNFDRNDELNEIILLQADNESELDFSKFIIINGYNMSFDEENTIFHLGVSYESYTENQILYQLGESGDRFYILFPRSSNISDFDKLKIKQMFVINLWSMENE
jgi:hypothetical protein